MSQVINTNIMSLNAQRNLAGTSTELATALQRLSSGLRINSAKDDAAGLAITERFTTQIRGLNQAVRNANDGISLAQTGEGALAEMTSNLQRIRELAVQSANATNSDSDRVALDQEVQQRLAEIDRIALQTSFNGRKILDGSFGNALFQVGANVGETINIELETSMRQASIGAVATADSVDLRTLINPEGTSGVYTSAEITDFDFATISPIPTESVASGEYTQAASDEPTDAFQFLIDSVVVSDRLVGEATAVNLQADIEAFIDASDGAYSFTGSLATDDLVIIKADGSNLTLATSFSDAVGSTNVAAGTTSDGTFDGVGFIGTHSDGELEDTSNNATIIVDGHSITLTSDTEAGMVAQIQAELDTAFPGEYTVSSQDGFLTIQKTALGEDSTAPVIGGDAIFTTDSTTEDGIAALLLEIEQDGLMFQVGDGPVMSVAAGEYATADELINAVNAALGSNASAAYDDANGIMRIVTGDDITVSGAQAETIYPDATVVDGNVFFEAEGSLVQVNVLTVDASNDAIYRIDSALTSVSNLRSTFGAVQNRFESTIANLSATVENLSASRSRIQDADFAAETAALTRAQILQQAGTAMLAQANQMPQSVLQLLQ